MKYDMITENDVVVTDIEVNIIRTKVYSRNESLHLTLHVNRLI